jgi:hypothetical protein
MIKRLIRKEYKTKCILGGEYDERQLKPLMDVQSADVWPEHVFTKQLCQIFFKL